jgi:DNA-binding response OmpR family regulator
MLSGRDPEKHRDGALAAGAVAYLAKPVTPEQLTAAVVEALGGTPASS